MAGLACFSRWRPSRRSACSSHARRRPRAAAGPAVRLAGVAEASVAQRQALQLAAPAGEGREELTVAVIGRNARRAGFEQALGLLVQAPPRHTLRGRGHTRRRAERILGMPAVQTIKT